MNAEHVEVRTEVLHLELEVHEQHDLKQALSRWWSTENCQHQGRSLCRRCETVANIMKHLRSEP